MEAGSLLSSRLELKQLIMVKKVPIEDLEKILEYIHLSGHLF
jgi:hypothetical protein